MIGVAERYEDIPARLAAAIGLLPELVSDLERDFDSRRPVVGEEDAREARRRDLDEAAGERDGRRARIAEEGGVCDSTELVDDGGIDLGPSVAEEVAPERCHAIEQATAIRVDEVVPLPRHDHE